MQQSVKAEDPFKVGKFGIGFNSVYHITGNCLAGDYSECALLQLYYMTTFII